MSAYPEHVDVIIVGTGLVNSILAAACSRIGKSVFHLDKNDYYGNYDASFTFQQLIDWIKTTKPDHHNLEGIPDDLVNKSRLFCIDLAPRFLFSNGDMVELLVKSNVARYHEFKNNIRILCLVGQNDIHVMPCRRNEVFTSPLLPNLVDKRRLMKFIELCIKYHEDDSGESVSNADSGPRLERSELAEHGDEPIGRYLEQRGLKPILREYIINSIAMIHPTDTMREACKRIKRFMMATEKYGRSPFLFPLYGCGEFPQSFCRLSAVFGGVYCLNTKVTDANVSDADDQGNRKFSIKFGNDNHTVTSDILVVDQEDAIDLHLLQETENSADTISISRAILITDKSVVSSSNKTNDDDDDEKPPSMGSDLISFLRIPPTLGKNANTIYLIELNSSALVCPKGLNVVYMWTDSGTSTPQQDLQPTIDRIFNRADLMHEPSNDEQPQQQGSCILWKYFYLQKSRKSTAKAHGDDRGYLYVTSPLFDDIDYAGIIGEAESIFKRMCPGQDFLPRAPNPDEIVHTD